MNDVLFWTFVNGAKVLADELGDAKECIKEGDADTAIKIINEVIEELTGKVITGE